MDKSILKSRLILKAVAMRLETVMLYRPHRGGLRESLEEIREFTTKQALMDYIKRDLLSWSFECGDQDILFEKYIYDARINWDTYIISVKNFGPVGFVNQNPDKRSSAGVT